MCSHSLKPRDVAALDQLRAFAEANVVPLDHPSSVVGGGDPPELTDERHWCSLSYPARISFSLVEFPSGPHRLATFSFRPEAGQGGELTLCPNWAARVIDALGFEGFKVFESLWLREGVYRVAILGRVGPDPLAGVAPNAECEGSAIGRKGVRRG